MKRNSLLVLAVATLGGILTAPLGAQAAHPMGRFDIPFQFEVNGKTMPAGEYMVGIRTTDGVVEIASQGAHRLTALSATHPAGNAAGEQPKLTFHRYGNQYFLAQISQPGGYPVREIRVSAAEREAVNAPSSSPLETVTLAAVRAVR